MKHSTGSENLFSFVFCSLWICVEKTFNVFTGLGYRKATQSLLEIALQMTCQGGLDCKPSSETANKLTVMVSRSLELEPLGMDEVPTYVLTGMAEVQSVIYRDDIWGLMKLVFVNQTLTQR